MKYYRTPLPIFAVVPKDDKVPVWIVLRDEPISSLAGLWNRWKDAEGNPWRLSHNRHDRKKSLNFPPFPVEMKIIET